MSTHVHAAPFVIANSWTQRKFSSTTEWVSSWFLQIWVHSWLAPMQKLHSKRASCTRKVLKSWPPGSSERRSESGKKMYPSRHVPTPCDHLLQSGCNSTARQYTKLLSTPMDEFTNAVSPDQITLLSPGSTYAAFHGKM